MHSYDICFIGDGFAEPCGDRTTRGWMGRLAEREAAAGHRLAIHRLGIVGQTSLELSLRWRRDVEARMGPGGVVFAFGAGDLADDGDEGVRLPLPEALAAAEEMLAEAAAEWPVLWLGPAPVLPGVVRLAVRGSTLVYRNSRIAALNGAFATLATQLGLPYLDLFERLAHDAQWHKALMAGDGVHPADAGHQMLADIVADWEPWRAWLGQPAAGVRLAG